MSQGALHIEDVRQALNVRRVGTQILWHETTGSTNDDAWQQGKAPGADGAVVLTDYQSAGRGRHGNDWQSPRGASLMLSVLLIDNERRLHGGDVGLIGAMATCVAINRLTELWPTIKWPNDVLIRGRKVGGVLVEARVSGLESAAYVLGIGVNCLQRPEHFAGALANVATSLDIESTLPIDRGRLAVELITELDHWFAPPIDWDHTHVVARWRSFSDTIGRHVTLQSAGEFFAGTVLDVDSDLNLVVQMDRGGVRTFASAETTLQSAPP